MAARTFVIAVALLVAQGTGASGSGSEYTRAPSPEGARLYIIAPSDGDRVTNPIVVRFGLSGMGVAPAGVAVEGTGHHHLLIDTELADPSVPVPADDQHRHFGGGQTEVTIELAPGAHTLKLVLGDANHVPHEPPVVSETITVTVE